MHNVLTAVVLSCRQDHVPCCRIWLSVRVGHHALQRLQSLLNVPRIAVHFEGSIIGPDCRHDTTIHHLIHLQSDAKVGQRQGSCQKQGCALHHLMHLHCNQIFPSSLFIAAGSHTSASPHSAGRHGALCKWLQHAASPGNWPNVGGSLNQNHMQTAMVKLLSREHGWSSGVHPQIG